MRRDREARVMMVVLILSMAGIGLATFLVANHYQLVSAEICEIGPWSSCEDVNKGPYSEVIPGLPWAVVGLAGFVAIFCLSYLKLYYPELDKQRRFIPLLVLFSVIGVIFVIYLNYLELFLIHKICIFCAASHIVMIVILVLVAWLQYVDRQEKVEAEIVADAVQTSAESE
jgi:uncharacterized membrane protein